MNPSLASRPSGFSPSCLARAGLGSNVSTCDGPPFMNRKITRLALAGKCAASSAASADCRVPARPSKPNPAPARRSRSRREIVAGMEKLGMATWLLSKRIGIDRLAVGAGDEVGNDLQWGVGSHAADGGVAEQHVRAAGVETVDLVVVGAVDGTRPR